MHILFKSNGQKSFNENIFVTRVHTSSSFEANFVVSYWCF